MKLNIGAGRDIREGWINADIVLLPGIEVLFDMDSVWPWDDDSCDEILARSVIEHSRDKVYFIEEMWRVAKHGAHIAVVSCPATAPNAWADPTHRSPMHWETFAFFTPGHPYDYYSHARFVCWKASMTEDYLEWHLFAYKREDPELLARQIDTRCWRKVLAGEMAEMPLGMPFGDFPYDEAKT